MENVSTWLMAEENTRPTMNRYGYMFKRRMPDIDKALGLMRRDEGRPVLDIGCAYGLTSKAMLDEGFCVIANDLDEKHLQVLADEVNADQRARLTLMVGNALELAIEESSLAGALCFNVIHFMSGDEIRSLFALVYKWLAPGGVFMVTTASPYCAPSEAFANTYYAKLNVDGVEWPGEGATIEQALPDGSANRDQLIRDTLHLNGCEVLAREAVAAGFRLFTASHTSIAYESANGLAEANIAYAIVIKK